MVPNPAQADLLTRLQSAERERDGANDERDAAERKADRASALAVEWFERAQSAERDRDALKAERDALREGLREAHDAIREARACFNYGRPKWALDAGLVQSAWAKLVAICDAHTLTGGEKP